MQVEFFLEFESVLRLVYGRLVYKGILELALKSQMVSNVALDGDFEFKEFLRVWECLRIFHTTRKLRDLSIVGF